MHLDSGQRVQRAEGFVQEDHVLIHEHGPEESRSLPHAAGEFVGIGMDALGGVGNAHLLERLDCALEGLGPLHSFVNLKRFGELLGNLEVGIEGSHGILENHGDPLSADGAQGLLGA